MAALDDAPFLIRLDAGGHVDLVDGDARGQLGLEGDLVHRDLEWVFGSIPAAAEAARAALAGSACSRLTRAGSLRLRFEPRRDAAGRLVGCSIYGLPVGKAERELARSEAQLRDAQDVAHVGSWEWDVTQDRVRWTDELYRIYGLAREEFAGTYKSFLDRVYVDDRAATRDVVKAALRAGKPFEYDHRIVRGDGAVRVLHTRGAAVLDPSRQPRRLVGCCWDVTDHIETRRQLEETLSVLRATLESTEDGIFVVDLEGRVVTYNRRAVALWEIPEDVLATADSRALAAHVCERLEDPEGFVRREEALLRDHVTERLDTIRFRDGRVFERYSQPQRAGDRVVGRVCSFRDVTERELLLRRAIFLGDASRLLASLDVEPALVATAKLALPLLGTTCAIDLFEPTGARRLLAITAPGAEPVEPELAHEDASASIRAVGSRSFLSVPLAARDGALGVLTFVAAPGRRFTPADLGLAEELGRRAALAIENGRLYRHIEAALHARDELLAVVSHEVRGPLAALHVAVQTLLKAPGPTRELVAAIERADRRLATFVDEVLDVVQIRAGPIRFSLEPVDLGEVTREVVAQLSPELARAESALSVTTEGSLMGLWDRSRVRQVVLGLVSNAIKFGLGRPIAVTLEGRAASVRLTVADGGLGIPPERREAIFHPFERAVAPRHYGGLGLGLYIARTIVEGLGGTIAVHESKGGGSVFTVELPKRGAQCRAA